MLIFTLKIVTTHTSPFRRFVPFPPKVGMDLGIFFLDKKNGIVVFRFEAKKSALAQWRCVGLNLNSSSSIPILFFLFKCYQCDLRENTKSTQKFA